MSNTAITVLTILAAIFIVFALIFKTTTYKGTIAMRSLNGLGNLLFVIGGAFDLKSPTAIALLICNGCGLLLNIFYIVRETLDYRKNKSV